MSSFEEQVDGIVRAVLARLADADGAPPAMHPAVRADATATAPMPATNGAQTRESGAERELVIDSPVVSAAALDGKLAGVRRVLIRPRAVLTPSARDLLRGWGVAIATLVAPAGEARPGRPLVLATAETDFDTAWLIRLLARKGVRSEPIARSGLVSAMGELAERVRMNGELGLMLCDCAAAAICLGNRHKGVRAVWGADRAATAKAARAVGANLLAIEPAGKGPFEIVQIVESFLAAGGGACPERFITQLD